MYPHTSPFTESDDDVGSTSICPPPFLVREIPRPGPDPGRPLEALRFYAKDVELDRGEILVGDAKHRKVRLTVPPVRTSEILRAHLAQLGELHPRDLARGLVRVTPSIALAGELPRRRAGSRAGSGCFSRRELAWTMSPARGIATILTNR